MIAGARDGSNGFERHPIEPGRAGPLAEPDQERGDPDADRRPEPGIPGRPRSSRCRRDGSPTTRRCPSRRPAGSGKCRRPARRADRGRSVRTHPLNRYQPPGRGATLLAERGVRRLRGRDAQRLPTLPDHRAVRTGHPPGRRRSRHPSRRRPATTRNSDSGSTGTRRAPPIARVANPTVTIISDRKQIIDRPPQSSAASRMIAP